MIEVAIPGLKAGDSAERGAPTRGVSFWLLVCVLALSPLPFASIDGFWQSFWAVLIGAGLVFYAIPRWSRRRAFPRMSLLVLAAAALVSAVALWGFVQASPDFLATLANPVWQLVSQQIQLPNVVGYISVAPERTLGVSVHYLSYIGFGILVLWHCRSQRNTELLLKIFIGAQATYALYGLVVYFSGAEMILWFEKWAYRGVLTGTFVNRNSYATYAGLGLLAALTLVLRYLRKTLSDERSHITQIRDFVETLTSRGWLPPMVVLVCFLAILLTGSRMGLMAVLIAASVMLVRWVALLPRGQARRVGAGMLSVLVALLVLNFVLSGGLTAERFERLFTDGDGRFDVYPLILGAIDQRPWTGYGLGTFETAFRTVRDANQQLVFDRAHSDYLELVMDGGWISAVAIVTAFLCLLVAAWRASAQRREFEFAILSVAATVQIGVHSTVDFSMQMPAVVYGYLFLAMVGLGSTGHARQSFTDGG